MARITHFRQLDVWQQAHKLVLMVYQVTAGFPSDERFGLVSQMRRAAVSVPANLMDQADTVGRLLNGLISSTERRRRTTF